MRALAGGLGLRRRQLGVVIALGFGDLAAGALLVARPRAVEALLGLAASPAAAVPWLRWIGIFVAAVGAALLAPLAAVDPRARRERLRFALGGTAGVRLAVAGYLASSVLAGGLASGWWRVGAYDALAATVQLLLLAAWRRADES